QKGSSGDFFGGYRRKGDRRGLIMTEPAASIAPMACRCTKGQDRICSLCIGPFSQDCAIPSGVVPFSARDCGPADYTHVGATGSLRGVTLIFEDLRAFVVVVQHGSFAKAAADLCIAQSALSKRVQRIEHRMGAALLERRARGVALTEAGHAF